MNRVEVQPALLKWAIERSRRDPKDLLAKFPKLPDWQKGHEMPTLRQLEQFAHDTRTPIGYLFLESPPVEKVPIPDYRTIGSAEQQHPSPDLLETIYVCQQRQEWYREHARLHRLQTLPFVESAKLTDDEDMVASSIRKTLGYTLESQVAAKTWEEALTTLIALIDEAGVLVMRNGIVGLNTHRPLNPKEFRGFCLADDVAPLIFINAADSKAAQMFTIAHELAHIWLGTSSLDDVSASGQQVDIERWCNGVAAELLVPLAEFNRYAEPGKPLRSEMDRLSRTFKVSTLVILHRMADAGAISRAQMRAAYEHEEGRLAELARSSGGNFYTTQAARVGKRFARAVMTDTLEGNTLHRDAFRLLGVTAKTFDTFGEHVGVEA